MPCLGSIALNCGWSLFADKVDGTFGVCGRVLLWLRWLCGTVWACPCQLYPPWFPRLGCWLISFMYLRYENIFVCIFATLEHAIEVKWLKVIDILKNVLTHKNIDLDILDLVVFDDMDPIFHRNGPKLLVVGSHIYLNKIKNIYDLGS